VEQQKYSVTISVTYSIFSAVNRSTSVMLSHLSELKSENLSTDIHMVTTATSIRVVADLEAGQKKRWTDDVKRMDWFVDFRVHQVGYNSMEILRVIINHWCSIFRNEEEPTEQYSILLLSQCRLLNYSFFL